ncbi:MAG: ATP-binding protein [Pseudomarimonas sp.]
MAASGGRSQPGGECTANLLETGLMAGKATETGSLKIRFDTFELDEANARLLRGQQPVALAPTPFGLLCALARHAGSLLSKHTLLDAVWGHRFVSDSVLKGAISDIRTALGDDPREPRFIQTVARRGYRFIAQAHSTPTAPMPIAPRAGIPSTADLLPSRTFVGRAPELARLQQAWQEACSGRRQIVWVAGEPGIGKSTLIEQFIAGLGDTACARGDCVQSFGTGEPYHAVLDALSELGRSDESIAPLLRAVAPTWLLQLPWLCTADQRESLLRELVGVHPERMLREIGEFLDRYTEQRPLLLVTEDLHWADPATAQLIDYMARRRTPSRLMWLSSFRLAEVVALDRPVGALRHELRARGLCVEIVLDSFNEREIADYLAGHAPQLAQDEAFVRALHARTEGVPLFVESVIGDVASRATTSASAEAVLAEVPVPQNLAALIDHYLARLDTGRRALLTAAAVCGASFCAELLAQVLGRDLLSVSEDCEALARDRFWLVAPQEVSALDGAHAEQYGFRHALYRQALLDRAAPATRADLHRRVAQAMEQERDSGVAIAAKELAVHFEQGKAPLPALRYYAEASKAALRQLSPAECLALTERALALVPQVASETDRANHEIVLATLRGVAAFHVYGAGEVARDAFTRAAARMCEAPDHPMRGLLLHGLGFLLSLRGEYDEALLTAARAEALGDATDDALLVVAAGTVQGQVHNVQGRPEACRRAVERTIPVFALLAAAAETRLLGFIGDPQVTARGLLSLPLVHLGLLRQAREQLDQAHARARSLGQPMAIMIAIWFEALVQIRLGDIDRVAGLACDMYALVDEHALAQGRTACRWFQGWAEAHRGRPREGFERIRAAFEANVALGMLSGGTETLTYAAGALVMAGDFDAAQAQIDEARRLVEQLGERVYLPQLLQVQSAIARGRGDQAAAAAAIRSAVSESRSQGALWVELLTLNDLVEYVDATDDEVTSLAELVNRLEEARDTLPMARALSLLAARNKPDQSPTVR